MLRSEITSWPLTLAVLLAAADMLAASLTLLPAVLATLGPGIDRFALPWAGAAQHRSEPFARWGRLIWRRPVLVSALAAGLLLALALPVLHLHTAMPTAGVLTNGASARTGYERLQHGFGSRAPLELQVVAPRAPVNRVQTALRRSDGVAAVLLPEQAGRLTLVRVQPTSREPGELIERLRTAPSRGRSSAEPQPRRRSRASARGPHANRVRARANDRLRPAADSHPRAACRRRCRAAESPHRSGRLRRRQADLPGRRGRGRPRL